MASYRQRLAFVLLALAGVWTPSLGLRDVRIAVPAHVLRGRSARLSCHYQLEEERLYAVKWYKGRHEFYRYTPSEQPFKKAFPPLGSHVDLKQSSGTHVTLVNADDSVAGRYSCEVSADAPSFHTLLVSDSLEVVDAPRQRPHLSGLRSRYRPGDTLNVTCTAGASRPPAQLAFIVNDVQQEERSVRPRPPVEEGSSGLSRSRVSLVLPVTSSLAPRVRVRCVASIGAVYWQSAEKSAAVAAPHQHQQPHESSGDWHGLPADDDDEEEEEDSELQQSGERRQQQLHGRGRPQHDNTPPPTAAPADVRQPGASGGAAAAQLCSWAWCLLVAACVHLQLQLQLLLQMADAPA